MKTTLIELWHALVLRLKGRFNPRVLWTKFIEIVTRKKLVAGKTPIPPMPAAKTAEKSKTTKAALTSPTLRQAGGSVETHALNAVAPVGAVDAADTQNDHYITPSRIRKVVDERWQLRYNELDNNIELRDKDGAADFLPMTDRLHNTLVMNVQEELPQCYRSWVDCYLYSEAVPSYHPLRQYLKDLPQWDGTDRVGRVASMVSDDPLWHLVFRRWLRAMVAGWMQAGEGRTAFVNHLAPVLVSAQQGLGKSTFCRSLLPPSLRAYYTDKFDLTSDSHAERQLGCMALVNMDEFDRYSERQMGVLKNLMQMTQLSMRRPHGRSMMVVPRVASFIGTSNFDELLTDPSGSRRFYCQVVTRYIGAIEEPHDQLYAQLVAEIAAGEPVLFTKEEEAEIERHNALYYRESPLEAAFAQSFRLPAAGERGQAVWLSATEIFEHLKRSSSRALQGITAQRMGKLLRRLGAEKRHSRVGNCYAVMYLPK